MLAKYNALRSSGVASVCKIAVMFLLQEPVWGCKKLVFSFVHHWLTKHFVSRNYYTLGLFDYPSQTGANSMRSIRFSYISMAC